jgi:putative ABC transport system permease protein
MQISAHQVTWDFVTIAARTTGDPAALERALERVLVEVDPLMPAQDVLRVSTLVAATTAAERFHAFLLAGFASLALALAAAGVYGVLAYAVRLRSRELGVRLALGARRSQVLAMVVWSGVVLAGAGVALGLAAAVPATRLVSGMLFGVRPLDPMTLAGVAALLLVVSVAACLRPAWRASRLDPVRILRED